MDLFDAIKNRRSIRKFLDKPVPDEAIMKCLEAARWAPSWANTQCARFVIIRDKDLQAKISDKLSERNPARRAVIEAPAVVLFCAKLASSGYKGGNPTDDKQWHMFDAGLAMENFMLAAHSLGLGTVVVGYLDYKSIGGFVGVPEGFQVVALTPLGYPAAESSAPQRLELNELAFENKWGNPMPHGTGH
jgi:nitroreductase